MPGTCRPRHLPFRDERPAPPRPARDGACEGHDVRHLTGNRRDPDPLEQFVALLRQEMVRLPADPNRNRLFLEFWNAGLWSRDIRMRMQRELDRYREAFRPMAEAVISADVDRFAGVTPASLAAVAVSFIKGCAVQSMVEPQLDTVGFLRAVETLLGASSLVKD